MLGFPFTLRRFGDRGVEDIVIYLRSRRRGPEGEAMRKHIREFNRASMGQSKAASRAGVLLARALAPSDADGADRLAALERIDADQAEAMAEAERLSTEALEHAEKVAELALRENYPAERVREILDGLTDRELTAIVGTIELGAMPRDFFQSLDTQPRPSSTPPSGPGPAPSSSLQAGDGLT